MNKEVQCINSDKILIRLKLSIYQESCHGPYAIHNEWFIYVFVNTVRLHWSSAKKIGK